MKNNLLFFLGLLIDVTGLAISAIWMMTEQLNGSKGFDNPGFLCLVIFFLLLIVSGVYLRWAKNKQWSMILVWIPTVYFLIYGSYTILFKS